MSQTFYITVAYLSALIIIGTLVSRSVSRYKKTLREMARRKASKGLQ